MLDTEEVTSLGITTPVNFLTGNVGGGMKWFSSGHWGTRVDYRLMMVKGHGRPGVLWPRRNSIRPSGLRRPAVHVLRVDGAGNGVDVDAIRREEPAGLPRQLRAVIRRTRMDRNSNARAGGAENLRTDGVVLRTSGRVCGMHITSRSLRSV